MSSNKNKRKKNKCLIKFLFLFFLSIASIILLVTSFVYVAAKNRQINNSSYYQISSKRFNDITTIVHKEQWKQFSATNLLEKNKINVNFIGKSNNLGIIAIPFDTHNKSINDKVVFRLKETGRKEWYYQAIYNANQIQNNIPFPFGFPVIKNSENISYTFEIESLNGTPNDSISISKANYFFFTKYVFSKSELLENPYKLFQFLAVWISERVQLLTADELVFISLSFLSPFIVFVCVYDIYIRETR